MKHWLTNHRTVFLLLGFSLCSQLSWADVQVNTYTTSSQGEPSVALDSDGDFVVVWESSGSGGTDPDQSIQGQRYASDGSPAGNQFQVNTYTTKAQFNSSVSADSDGDFVVVWESRGSGGTDSYYASIQARRFASDGSPVGNQFQVNTFFSGVQRQPSVALDSDGDFVVVWESIGSATDPFPASIEGQRYASDGSPIGKQFQVNTYSTDSQENASVSLDSDGDFVVVWQSRGSGGTDSSYFSIQGQRYASDGSPAESEFQVNTYTTGGQTNSSVSLDSDGDFVVVWISYGSEETDSFFTSVQGQRYTSDGSPAGNQFQINTYTTGSQVNSSVSLDSDGDFVVVWWSRGSVGTDSEDSSIQGQRYTSDGSPVGSQVQVNTYTTGSQEYSSVSLDSDGDFVVVWESDGSEGTDSSSTSIQARQFKLSLLVDGFESGDTSGWSGSAE